MIISVSLLTNLYPTNAEVYTDSDLEQYKSRGDSPDDKQTEKSHPKRINRVPLEIIKVNTRKEHSQPVVVK